MLVCIYVCMYVRPKLTFVSFLCFFCTLPLTGPSKIFVSTRKNKVTELVLVAHVANVNVQQLS